MTEWVQDPDGGWHQKQKMTTGAKAWTIGIVLTLTAGGVGFGVWEAWSSANKDAQRRTDRVSEWIVNGR